MMPPSGSRCLAVTCSDLPDHGQAISRGLPPAGQGGWTCGAAHGRTSADTYRTVRRFSFWSAIRAGQLNLSESSVEKHVNALFAKLGLSVEQLSHRRVTAVLTFLRDAGLRG
jgi:hypothetical protein